MDGNEDEQSLEQILDKVKKTDNTCDYKGCKQVRQLIVNVSLYSSVDIHRK